MSDKTKVLKMIVFFCVIVILISIKLIMHNKYVLNINSKNIDNIEKILENNHKIKGRLTKIETYKEWHHYYVVLHTKFNAKYLVIMDNDLELEKITTYVKRNGYETSKIGYVFIIISLSIIIFCQKNFKKRK